VKTAFLNGDIEEEEEEEGMIHIFKYIHTSESQQAVNISSSKTELFTLSEAVKGVLFIQLSLDSSMSIEQGLIKRAHLLDLKC